MKFLTNLVIAVLLIGCGGGKKSDTFVEYRRTGGFIGLDDYMTIDQEGNAILKRRNTQTEFKLDGDTMNRLETLLNDAKFTKLKNEYLPSRQGGDLIEYTITYSGHTVRMMDTAVPETIQPVLESLNQIVESEGKP
jgi:hypothetical protein